MEERRLLLAVALSLLVLTAYRLLVPAAPVPETPPPPQSTSAAAEAEVVAPRPPASAPVLAPVLAVAAEREHRVEVLGPDITVAFTNRGARLVSWRLARYKDATGKPEEMVQTIPTGPRALDIETGEAELDQQVREALFRPSSEILTLPASGSATLSFDFAEGDLVVRKALRFEARGYLVGVSGSIVRAGRSLPVKLIWGPDLGNPTPAEMDVRGYQAPHAVALLPGGVERMPTEKLTVLRPLGEARWVGIESHYFAAVLVPPGAGSRAEVRPSRPPLGGDESRRLAATIALELPTQAGETLVYVGPKDYPSLARLGHELVQIVPVGEWIGPIVVGLMRLLRFVQGHVGNYGWSIVALTALINLAMSPLRHISIANGVKMARIAPEMKVIQERYRGIPALDKRREQMQKEMGALYAKHGMSMGSQMAVGCLPLLLTMPFLIAFYRVLDVSIELRGASFLWLPDLSQKDPLFLTPLLMGASMFLMQKMTPTAMDPSQQRMMTIMPLVLMVMFFAAPAGLNLYWLSSNVCSILQQAVTLRIVRGAEATRKGERHR